MLRKLGSVPIYLLLAAAALASEPVALPSATGQTGLLAMPDARFAPDGTWRTGYAFHRPYHAMWSSLTAMPWFEGSFRYTRIQYVPGVFSGQQDPTAYGDYKDKGFDAKLRLVPEREWFPQLAAGAHDAGGGTGLFSAWYVVASKRLGDFDLTLGYGGDRIDGAFGGARWRPGAGRWSLVAEYDAFDYANDPNAAQSRIAGRKTGELALGVEYDAGAWGAKAYAAHGEAGVNAWVSVPLGAREFVPKIHEPAPHTRIVPRPTEAQWAEDPAHEARLRRALAAQGYEEIGTRYANGRLEARLANPRIASMPRAVGRAARTLLAFAPLEVRELRVTYVDGVLDFATYEFADARLLQRYFNGLASREMLAQTVAIAYAARALAAADADREAAIAAAAEPLPEAVVVRDEVPQLFGYRAGLAGGLFRIRPGLSIYFNDPSGAFKYDLSALATWDRRLAARTFFNSEVKATLVENVSDVTQPSNSLLPRVRTDIAQYKRESDFKLLKALFNQYYHPGPRLYARASAGVYEEMYSGAGGQLLWLSPGGGLAADVAVDALRQREFEGWLGHRDYSTVTAIASLHYRMAHGLTATLRAGRFLARDEGVRFEMKRRFASGFEVGAWYTVTNGNDITSPGTPDSPYYDKGIFMRMALNAMLTRDTRATANLAIAPWTRDVGQMVVSPGDLARVLEPSVRDRHDADGLREFGERGDEPETAGADVAAARGEPWPDFLAADAAYMGRAARETTWTDALVLGTGLVLSSAVLDKPVERTARRRAGDRWLKRGVKWGDALPVAALGLSGLFALDESRPGMQDAGIAALQAGALAIAGTEILKRGVGRARPEAGLGASEFDPGSSERRFHSFPSRTTTLMWAAVTPYAKEYGAPWLYGLAAFTNAARAGSREHWVSDTVAGSLLGYWLGTIAWEARRDARIGKNTARVALTADSVHVAWSF